MNYPKITISVVLMSLASIISGTVLADRPKTVDGVTIIHLDEYNGYFSAQETLTGLKAGAYEFVVTNRTNKLVGFQIQNLATKEDLETFPLESGETQSSRITVTGDGVRYRCPINPTPWYEVSGIADN